MNLLDALAPLCANDELAVLRRAPGLIPGLMRAGLSLEDAAALAHNAALVYYALREALPGLKGPRSVLEQLGLEEIAAACRELARRREEESL